MQNLNYIFKYAYIFDYSLCKIYEVKLDEHTNSLDEEKLLSHYNLMANECYIMYSATKLEIELLKN